MTLNGKSRMRDYMRLTFVLLVLCALGMTSAADEIQLRITGGDVDFEGVPIRTAITLPAELRESASSLDVLLSRAGQPGAFLRGQFVKAADNTFELWCVVPRLQAGSSHTWSTIFPSTTPGGPSLSWQDNEKGWLDLLHKGQPLVRFMYAHDTSDPQRRFETYKPFLHVYDHESRRLTNGPDGECEYLANQILYPHHRGIFIGWNRLQFKGKRYDLWHMSGVEQVHQKFAEFWCGPVAARATAVVHWNDDQGEPIIAEKRTMTVYRPSRPTMAIIDFHTELTAVRGDVELNGDPEHAGVQYRAHNDVADGGPDVKAKYLFHDEAIDPRKDKDLPWVAMTYGLGDKHYTVQHMNHPANPRGTIYSAYRDYGRFGAFFTDTIEKSQTLTLRYRLWIGQGSKPRRDRCAGRYAAYVNPPKVEVIP